MTEAEFELEKKKFVDNLIRQQNDRVQLERETVGQVHNVRWKQLRASLLTSSSFGKVCNVKSPESFAGIVQSILYEENMLIKKEIAHSDTYDSHAIEKLEVLENVKVEKCGLFIDKDNFMLAASPAGLIVLLSK